MILLISARRILKMIYFVAFGSYIWIKFVQSGGIIIGEWDFPLSANSPVFGGRQFRYPVTDSGIGTLYCGAETIPAAFLPPGKGIIDRSKT